MPLRRALVVFIFFIVCVASFGMVRTAFAITACQCSCVDASTTERVLTNAPDTNQTYLQKCQADNKCEGKVLVNAYDVIVTTAGASNHRTACECATPQVSTTFIRQAAGDTTCSGSCEASCRGQSLAVNASVAPVVVQTPCITDADCKTGIFAKFKGVTCMSQTNATGVVTRACNIPVSGDVGKENANIECANYGGTGMNGATCDFVAAGNVPSSYLITRPYLSGSNGSLTYQQRSYPGTSYPFAENLWTALDTDGGITNTPGICYLYGSQQADYSNMDVTKTLVQGPNGSKRYVCMKRKISQCGTVNVPQGTPTPVVKNSIRYSCMPIDSVPVSQRSTNCLTAGTYPSDDGKTTVKLADLCTTPKQLCCALHCTLDAECGAFKTCTNGECVAKTQCNTNDPTYRCRVASAAEKANPSTCLQPLLTPLCQSSSQSCCAPVNPAAVGSCASDVQNNQEFRSRFGANGWMDFSCLSATDLKNAGQLLLSDWKSGGSCIMTDVASTAGEAKSAARCGANKRCCQVSAVAPNINAELAARPQIGTTGCSKSLIFENSCINLSERLGFDSRGLAQSTTAQAAAFDSMYSYGLAVIGTGACYASPVSPENPFNTWECASDTSQNGVCCYSGLQKCDPTAPNPCTALGAVCHPQLGICIPSSLLSKQLSSEKCADRASAANDESLELIVAKNGIDRGDYTCQTVNSNDSLVANKCLLKGCTAPDGQTLADGKEFRCCVPGTGESPAATAATSGLGSSQNGGSAAKGPDTIGLSSCISSGQCQLDDILYSAANFANFLFKISGAIFLAIFVYAGFLYLTAGSTNRGAKGLEMIKQASIGLILLFAAYILINFIQSSFIASSTGTVTDKCGSTADTQNMTCQFLPVDANNEKGISEAVQSRGCVRQMCGGPKNRICCPFGASK